MGDTVEKNNWPHSWYSLASPVAQTEKNPLAIQETWVQSQGWEDPLQKGMATHYSTNAWRIPWTEYPRGLQSMGSQSQTRLSDWSDLNVSRLVSAMHQERWWLRQKSGNLKIIAVYFCSLKDLPLTKSSQFSSLLTGWMKVILRRQLLKKKKKKKNKINGGVSTLATIDTRRLAL